jgi:hypothetical protein
MLRHLTLAKAVTVKAEHGVKHALDNFVHYPERSVSNES